MNNLVYDANWDGKEVWAVIKPDGQHADFYESNQKRAEDYMLGEAMVSTVEKANEAGYKIERIK